MRVNYKLSGNQTQDLIAQAEVLVAENHTVDLSCLKERGQARLPDCKYSPLNLDARPAVKFDATYLQSGKDACPRCFFPPDALPIFFDELICLVRDSAFHRRSYPATERKTIYVTGPNTNPSIHLRGYFYGLPGWT
jgi:hypothetical protein